MPFKSDRQRKAFFARLNSNSPETPRIIRDNKDATRQELKRRGVIVNPKRSKFEKLILTKKEKRERDLIRVAITKKNLSDSADQALRDRLMDNIISNRLFARSKKEAEISKKELSNLGFSTTMIKPKGGIFTFVWTARKRPSLSNKSIFFPAKSKRLAGIISIKSPAAFNKSIRILKKGGFSTREKRALILAQNRAAAQLKRKDLSDKERSQFTKIAAAEIEPESIRLRAFQRRVR